MNLRNKNNGGLNTLTRDPYTLKMAHKSEYLDSVQMQEGLFSASQAFARFSVGKTQQWIDNYGETRNDFLAFPKPKILKGKKNDRYTKNPEETY